MYNIILDFGHGGINKEGVYTTAPGKMYKHENEEVAYEGVINRSIGGLIKSYLRVHGSEFNVVTTVNEDDPRDIGLRYRVRVANNYDPKETIFISIHSNASVNHNGQGFEIYTTKGITKSDDLATKIGNQVKSYYDHVNLKTRFDFSDNDLDKEVDFYVLRKTRCPAVLLECLFFDSKDDYAHLKEPGFQKDFAWHVYLGILEYIRKN